MFGEEPRNGLLDGIAEHVELHLAGPDVGLPAHMASGAIEGADPLVEDAEENGAGDKEGVAHDEGRLVHDQLREELRLVLVLCVKREMRPADRPGVRFDGDQAARGDGFDRRKSLPSPAAGARGGAFEEREDELAVGAGLEEQIEVAPPLETCDRPPHWRPQGLAGQDVAGLQSIADIEDQPTVREAGEDRVVGQKVVVEGVVVEDKRRGFAVEVDVEGVAPHAPPEDLDVGREVAWVLGAQRGSGHQFAGVVAYGFFPTSDADDRPGGGFAETGDVLRQLASAAGGVEGGRLADGQRGDEWRIRIQ